MGRHVRPRRRPSRLTLLMVAVTLAILGLCVWAIVGGQVDCDRPGIAGPWC